MSADAAIVSPVIAGATVNAENPWPGLLAFRETDQGYFQGRQAETEELLRLVLRERLTVLFSLSGLGKSSLLQAGLFPRLRQENIFPLYIRLDFAAEANRLADQVQAAITTQRPTHQIEAPTSVAGEMLWEYFHREGNNFWNARNRPVMPLLVFDQFEETFTLGRLDPERSAATDAFLDQLADLAECRPPAQLKDRIDDHPEEASTFNFGRHYYKVLLSLREDFLADLDALRARMPSLALNRMRLRRMNGEAALRVVSQAKNLIDLDVAEQVVRFVGADKRQPALADLEIEPALLSVVSRELNNRRRQLKEAKISASLLEGSQEQVLADFYQRSIADLAPEVRLFIEDHLLTVSGFRDSVALDNALSFPAVTRDAVNALVERRLVRREDRGGSQRLELTHDLLAGVVRAGRDNRHRREAAEKERAALLQAQEEALFRAKQRIRKVRKVAAVVVAVALAFIGSGIWVILVQRRALKAREETLSALRSGAEAQHELLLTLREKQILAQKNEQLAASLELLSKLNAKDVQAAVDSQSSATILPRVFVQIVNQADHAYAERIKANLVAAGVLVLGIQYVPQATILTRSDVRYYRDADEAEAQKIADILKAAGQTSVRAYIPSGLKDSQKVRPNTFEVWLANGSGASQ